MIREEAIRILDPETTVEALAEIEYYAGFSGQTAKVQAVTDACEIAVAALRAQQEQETVTDSHQSENVTNCNGLKGIHMMSRPWQPQDLLDDLQLLIDEDPDRYLNDRRTTLCMARDFLKEHFAEPGWISVKDRLPQEGESVIAE